MSSSNVILLYDIPGNVAGKAWSPNTWKTRYTLNYKGLPYKTIWVEYPDIAQVCKEIGATPTSTKEDGSPYFTLPAIYDPSTNTALSESARIARYLDKTYPGTPVLIPPETDAFHAAFQEALQRLVLQNISPLMLPPTCLQLNPPSHVYFRETRERMYGKKLEEFTPVGPIRDEHWQKVQDGYSRMSSWLTADGKDKLFFMGDKICYADISIAGWTVWMKLVLGPDSAEWAAIKAWDGGRWSRFMEHFEKYEFVDE
ncbi:hypothetical protein IEO21_01181 [Rhodonia placenta]|uniref:GST N-terminal domain-containing protein n=1 Tax=Rhodonia placenta TaxID=104341 RepID=A0A8H7PA89_9APHY|nr:hypothetical protein IEO21_01181 [Postia placenta]